MHFEDLLEEVGAFGTYQHILCFALIPLTTGLVAVTYYSQLLTLTVPPYTCRQGGVVTSEGGVLGLGRVQVDAFHSRLVELLSETPYGNEARQPYSCFQHDPNMTWPDLDNVTSLDQLPEPTLPCQSGWVYDFDVFFSTYASEHNWVCEDSWRPYLVVSIFWVGNTVGSWVWGVLSDIYGRRVAVVGSLVLYGAAGLASIFVYNFYGFTILRFLTGFSHHIITHLVFVLVVEYCGLSSRVVPLLTVMASYTLFSLATPALAWLIWSWRTVALLAPVSCLILTLSARWLPESASWLIARGRGEDARRQLERVASVNKRHLPHDMVTMLLTEGDTAAKIIERHHRLKEEEESNKHEGEEHPVKTENEENIETETGKQKVDNIHTKNGVRESVRGVEVRDNEEHTSGQSVLQVFKYPGLRRNVLLVLVVWMLACMCYYGHCQNTANLGSGVLVSYLLGALVEVPAWCVPWLIHRAGRRHPLVLAFFVSSVAGFVYAMVPNDTQWLLLTMGLLGRATITGAYYVALQYGPEIFPTVVRGQGVALAETLGGVAIFISPLVVYLGEYERRVPLVVLAGLSVVAGGATLLLPETKGVSLPQTITQAEDFARHRAPRCCGSGSVEREGGGRVEDGSQGEAQL